MRSRTWKTKIQWISNSNYSEWDTLPFEENNGDCKDEYSMFTNRVEVCKFDLSILEHSTLKKLCSVCSFD